LEYAVRQNPSAASWTFYHGEGCPKCSKTGFRGRSGIFEYLEVTDTIREMITRNAGAVEFRKKAIGAGMEPMALYGLSKVKAGLTTIEEVMSVCAGDDEY
jgi:type II secretory ATPase GspE/PulE/Tfp pilus assembly ATPase PilB-like protein